MHKPHVIAHRGVSVEAPENTLTAFKKAIDLNVDFIELDVHLTADKVPVVFHDDTLSRTTNENLLRFVSDLTLEEIKQLDAGSWFDKSFHGEPIPTLQEVLELDRGSTGLIIEIKAANQMDKGLPPVVLSILEEQSHRKNNSGPIYLCSFSSSALKELQQLSSKYTLQGIASDTKTLTRHLEIGIKHLSLSEKLITKKMIADYHQRGISVVGWTVDDLGRCCDLIADGVDGICTNDPRMLLEHLNPIGYADR